MVKDIREICQEILSALSLLHGLPVYIVRVVEREKHIIDLLIQLILDRFTTSKILEKNCSLSDLKYQVCVRHMEIVM